MKKGAVAMCKETITVFAASDCEYEFEDDMEKVHQYYKIHGYGFLLTFSSELEELVNELKAIKKVINILTEWKSEYWFELSKTTYEIDWYHCWKKRNEKDKTKVTLLQAKKLYKDTKAKYDLLVGIIQETFRIHSKDSKDNEYCISEFLTEIEI